MTADDGGGAPFSGSTKLGPLPAWGWALGAGALLGLVWFLRSSKAPAAAAATGQQTPGQQPPQDGYPTDFIPVDQGMQQNQFDQIMGGLRSDQDMQQNMLTQILGAIRGLQGSLSTPTPPPIWGGSPPTAGPPVQIPAPVPAPPPPAPAPQPQDPGTQWIDVHSGDSFASIAARYGRGWQELWNYQLQPGIRPPETQATLRQRGPNNALFNGSSVAVPGNWRLV